MSVTISVLVLVSVLGVVTSVEHVHHNNTMMEDYMNQVTTSYPDLVQLYTIGQSIRGTYYCFL